jgi:hypothetical protein
MMVTALLSEVSINKQQVVDWISVLKSMKKDLNRKHKIVNSKPSSQARKHAHTHTQNHKASVIYNAYSHKTFNT